MELRRFHIDGVLEIIPRRNEDERGYLAEVFRDDLFRANVADAAFVQENQSLSVRTGTIRGVHFQVNPAAQGKLVRCLAGRIFDVAVDLRNGSPTFGQWLSVELSPQNNNQLWVPVGFGHGFCTLEPNSVIAYRVTDYYSPDNDKGLAWNDADVGVAWPELADPDTLSAKDRQQPSLAQLPAYFSVNDRCA